MLSAILRKRPLGEFTRNAGTVMIGTLVAQILPLLFYPIFTRIFTPADFGTFATVSMIATPLAILASGAYEQAFLLLKSDRAALHLFSFVALRCAAVLTPCLAVLIILRVPIAEALNDPALTIALLLVPLISLGQVVYNCTAEWLVRRKAFGALTGNRIFQSALLSLAKLGFGLGGWVGGGLVLGEALGRLAYLVQSYWRFWRKPLSHMAVSRRRMSGIAKRYRNFPRLMVPDQLINTFGGSIHVLIIGYAFGPSELGYVSLLFSALYLPVTVVSSSIKDVFRQRASVDYARDGSCRGLYVKLLGPVALLGLVGFGLLYLIAPSLFALVFGPEWIKAGEYARILVPMFFFNFVAMSLGGVLVIAQRMGVSLGWQVSNLVLAAIALVVGVTVFGDVVSTLALFTAARSISYLHYMVISFKYAKRPVRAQTIPG